MDWFLYFLVFIFGYVTCSVFYFLRSARISLRLLRSSQIVYLSTIIKALECYYYARGIVLEHMLVAEKSGPSITTFEFRFDEDIKRFKTSSLETLKGDIPEFFEKVIEFEDWEQAMAFLEENRAQALDFWSKSD
jgi:hypothetical protein